MKKARSGSDNESEEEEADDFEEEQKRKAQLLIQDQTNTNLVNLRRAIYLTIMSSLNFEECAHKLLKLDIQPGEHFF
jgi:pre-mRNA-splicing factor CWC22